MHIDPEDSKLPKQMNFFILMVYLNSIDSAGGANSIFVDMTKSNELYSLIINTKPQRKVARWCQVYYANRSNVQVGSIKKSLIYL